jgi:hypothetical protein
MRDAPPVIGPLWACFIPTCGSSLPAHATNIGLFLKFLLETFGLQASILLYLYLTTILGAGGYFY